MPLTVLRLRAAHRAAVVELGMNHPGEIAVLARIAQATVALVNNAQREHQEFMGTVEAVARENGAAIEALPGDGVAVFPCDDEYADIWQAQAGKRRCLRFALADEADGEWPRAEISARARWVDTAWQVEMTTPEGQARMTLRVAGRHNVRNALAATAAALGAGVAAGRRRARPRVVRAGQGPLAAEVAAPRAAARSRWSTTPTTPTPTPCAPPSTCSPGCPRRAGCCWATWARSATRARRSTRRSAPTRRRAASTRSGAPATLCAHAAHAYGAGARHFADTPALLAALGDSTAAEPAFGVGAGQGLALHGHGARRGAADRARRQAREPTMLLSLASWLQEHYPQNFGFLRVFQYHTFRAVMAAMTALLIGLFFGPWVIRRLTELKIGQPIRDYGVQSHMVKRGTPTMGGVLVLIGIAIATLLWSDWSNRFVWIVMLVTFGFGAIGWSDDWRKVVQKNPEGMPSREKYLWQSLIGLVAALYLAFSVSETSNLRVLELFMRWVTSGFANDLPPKADLMLPFFKTVSYPLGVFGFIAMTYFVIVGASNAVNLTDGLDGLAIMPVVLVAGALGLFAYIVGNAVYSKYLLFPYIPGAGELLIFCSAIAGAGLAFLWFNAHPAQVFMGDVGALSLGGALGTIAVITRQEIVLGIMGGVFVAEALSVMAQVGYFKYTKRKYGEGRRILKMAPLHHHFEKSGWTETQVVIRFWIVTMLLCLVGLASLKLR